MTDLIVSTPEPFYWRNTPPRETWQTPARPPATLVSSTRGLVAVLLLAITLLGAAFMPIGADRSDLQAPATHHVTASPCQNWGPAPAGYTSLKALVMDIPGALDHDWRAIVTEIEVRNGSADPNKITSTPSSCTG